MSTGFIIMHHGGTSLDLTLTLSRSHRSVASKMTDPGNILCRGGSVSPSSVQHIFPKKKHTFQSHICISTCCYGNRHPALTAGLVWPELVESFKKKKKKKKRNPSHIAAFHTEMPLGTVKCSRWKELQSTSHQLRQAALSNPAQSTGLIRNTMPH